VYCIFDTETSGPFDFAKPADADGQPRLASILSRYGVPVVEILDRFTGEVLRQKSIMVAHNAQYDLKIMRGELRRAGMPDLYGETPSICTMRSLQPVLRIPSTRGAGWKWPKLSEAVTQCLGRDHANAHGALPDVMACLDLLRWMKREGCMPEPSFANAA
jgi:DNA polymerase III epsilon subunit-like protein